MRWAVLLPALLVLTGCFDEAGTLADRAKRDELAQVERDDPHMAAAMRKSREALPDFLTLARAPRPTTTNFAVKIGIPAEGNRTEYFWIQPFAQHGSKYAGRINNTPRMVKTVKFGQTIEFSEDEIVDWVYHESGKMHGNYTACALLKHEPPDQAEAFKKEFGLSCDL